METRHFCFKPRGVRYFVPTVLGNEDSRAPPSFLSLHPSPRDLLSPVRLPQAALAVGLAPPSPRTFPAPPPRAWCPQLQTTVLNKISRRIFNDQSSPVGLREILESSTSLPSVQSVSLLTTLFPKLLLLLLEDGTGRTSGDVHAWMRSSPSNSSSELNGGVLNKGKAKQGHCFRASGFGGKEIFSVIKLLF